MRASAKVSCGWTRKRGPRAIWGATSLLCLEMWPAANSSSASLPRIWAGGCLRNTPAPRRLTDREIELLTRWIAQGAPWQKHWSFLPPRRPPLPEVHDSNWPKNAIDRFVLARLEREGLKPSPEADRRTLIRRVSFDLTGLPPTPAEVEAFVRDSSPNAYDKVVTRLLDSPRYGERMAARWLDAARYADTNGYQTDAERSMWRWRDWVIDAFNRNLPYDRFTVEQIAGDLLPGATRDQIIATGFNRNHRANGEGGIIPEEYAVEYVVDRVDTTSTVWLGVTLGLRALPQPQVRPLHAKRVLPDVRLLQPRAGARQRVQVWQLAAGDRGSAPGSGVEAEVAGTAPGESPSSRWRVWSHGSGRRRPRGRLHRPLQRCRIGRHRARSPWISRWRVI